MARRPKPTTALLKGLGPRECACGAKPDVGPLPWGWVVRLVRDAAYEKGYHMPITCPKCEEKL